MNYEFRPIERWPGELTRKRKHSPFRSGYNDTLKLLDFELRQLDATQVIFQVALSESDIRLDGRPRAGSRPAHPGVILSFNSKHGPLNYPSDRFDAWEDNLRAIALSLQHLRAVDRYGVTRRGEQYTGWRALGAPNQGMSKSQASQLIESFGGEKAALFATHPDRGGDAEQFKRVQEARKVLGLI